MCNAPKLNLFPQMDELARRVLAGEVVFFVGAGFSVDSERLTANRLMQRLLVRLYALDQLQPAVARGKALKRLAGMFNVDSSLQELAANWSNVERLAFRYYEVNEWMCRSFGELLGEAVVGTHSEFCQKLGTAEEAARTSTGWNEEEFQPVPMAWWDQARAHPKERTQLGKLLFVQTLGFHDFRVMAGTPFELMQAPMDLERSLAGRLKLRHHVLARFAREGFCPTLVTTNFDLLLEGAMRLAGFLPGSGTGDTALTAIPGFDVIASPQKFFQRGKAFRTATLLKIHGCAGHLRTQGDDLEAQINYLPQLVYTYREIQNWRDHSWAADYLRTLLRTRTLVFAGYSTADPVMHDTFRSIYEEMSRKGDDPRATSARPQECAPAYFLAFTAKDNSHEFHGNEVLISASRAVGAQPQIPRDSDHPNYLRFAPLNRADSEFLNLDELLPLIHHRILRQQQQDAIKAELPALIARLDRRRPGEELNRIQRAFDHLAKAEPKAIEEAPDIASARRGVRHQLAWSAGFHHALRREWARGLVLGKLPGQVHAVAEMEHPLWYFPASERPAWTAWSAVLELALRRLARLAVEHWSAKPLPDGMGTIEATQALRPTVFFRQHAAQTAPIVSLTLQLRGFDRPARRPDVPGHPARKVIWLFHEDALPWSNQKAAVGAGYPMGADCWRPQPSVEVIWKLALGDATPEIVPKLLVA